MLNMKLPGRKRGKPKKRFIDVAKNMQRISVKAEEATDRKRLSVVTSNGSNKKKTTKEKIANLFQTDFCLLAVIGTRQ